MKKVHRASFTKKIERGPNKGDAVTFKTGPSGKPYPVRVVKDVGSPSTLRDNSGVQFGKKKKSKSKKMPFTRQDLMDFGKKK